MKGWTGVQVVGETLGKRENLFVASEDRRVPDIKSGAGLWWSSASWEKNANYINKK